MSARPPHVFISYSHVDEAWKDRLVRQLQVLAQEGAIEVWHDRQIGAGGAWKTQIEQAIDRADKAILLISADFLTSAFIREEEVSRILKHRESKGLSVIPVIVRPCAWQAIDWLKDIQARPQDGRPLSAGSEHQIESDLAALALEIMELPIISTPRPSPLEALWARARAFGLAILPTVLVGALVTVSMAMRVTTPLQLDMVARGVSLTVAGTDPVQLLNNSTVFSRLVIEGCDLVSFPALSIGLSDIAVASPSGVNFRCDAGVPGAKIVLRAIHGDPSQELGSLGGLMAHPGDRVSFEISGASPPDIRVEASRKASFTFSITSAAPFEIVSEFAEPEGIALPVDPDRVATYRALLDSSAERLATVTAGRGLNIVLVPARDADVEGLFRADVNIPLESVSLFQRSDVDDRIVSTAVSGTLTYPGRSDVDSVPIETGDIVTLRGLTGFRLTQLSVDRKNSGLGLSFRGRAAEVSTDAEDRRLTLFDFALFNRNLKILGIAAAFAFQLAWLRKYRRSAAEW